MPAHLICIEVAEDLAQGPYTSLTQRVQLALAFHRGLRAGGVPDVKVLLSWDSEGVRSPCCTEFEEHILHALRHEAARGEWVRRGRSLMAMTLRRPVPEARPRPGMRGWVLLSRV